MCSLLARAFEHLPPTTRPDNHEWLPEMIHTHEALVASLVCSRRLLNGAGPYAIGKMGRIKYQEFLLFLKRMPTIIFTQQLRIQVPFSEANQQNDLCFLEHEVQKRLVDVPKNSNSPLDATSKFVNLRCLGLFGVPIRRSFINRVILSPSAGRYLRSFECGRFSVSPINARELIRCSETVSPLIVLQMLRGQLCEKSRACYLEASDLVLLLRLAQNSSTSNNSNRHGTNCQLELVCAVAHCLHSCVGSTLMLSPDTTTTPIELQQQQQQLVQSITSLVTNDHSFFVAAGLHIVRGMMISDVITKSNGSAPLSQRLKDLLDTAVRVARQVLLDAALDYSRGLICYDSSNIAVTGDDEEDGDVVLQAFALLQAGKPELTSFLESLKPAPSLMQHQQQSSLAAATSSTENNEHQQQQNENNDIKVLSALPANEQQLYSLLPVLLGSLLKNQRRTSKDDSEDDRSTWRVCERFVVQNRAGERNTNNNNNRNSDASNNKTDAERQREQILGQLCGAQNRVTSLSSQMRAFSPTIRERDFAVKRQQQQEQQLRQDGGEPQEENEAETVLKQSIQHVQQLTFDQSLAWFSVLHCVDQLCNISNSGSNESTHKVARQYLLDQHGSFSDSNTIDITQIVTQLAEYTPVRFIKLALPLFAPLLYRAELLTTALASFRHRGSDDEDAVVHCFEQAIRDIFFGQQHQQNRFRTASEEKLVAEWEAMNKTQSMMLSRGDDWEQQHHQMRDHFASRERTTEIFHLIRMSAH